MNTYKNRKIANINGDSTRPIRLDPRGPMPHIICPEARPYVNRSLLSAALAGFGLGLVLGSLATLIL